MTSRLTAYMMSRVAHHAISSHFSAVPVQNAKVQAIPSEQEAQRPKVIICKLWWQKHE